VQKIHFGFALGIYAWVHYPLSDTPHECYILTGSLLGSLPPNWGNNAQKTQQILKNLLTIVYEFGYIWY
jgi:hypothetical protein